MHVDIHSLNESVKALNRRIDRVGVYTGTYFLVRSFLNDPAGLILGIIRHVATLLCWWFIIGSITMLVTGWGMLGWLGIEYLLGHHDTIQKFFHK